MLRIAKLTDYAIVLLAHFARASQEVHTARDLARRAGLPHPTVGKILKSLSRSELLVSRRGVKGGYSLARPASQISVADVIFAMEGALALTECSRSEGGACELEGDCPTRKNWRRISDAVRGALEAVSLEEMLGPPEMAEPAKAELVLLSRK